MSVNLIKQTSYQNQTFALKNYQLPGGYFSSFPNKNQMHLEQYEYLCNLLITYMIIKKY